VLVAARCPFREHGAVDMGLPEPYRMVSVDFAAFRLSGVYMRTSSRKFLIGKR
jgi:hypothetical protein